MSIQSSNSNSELLNNYKQFLLTNPHLHELDPSGLPDDLKISTITLTCKLPVRFNVILIAKYLTLSPEFVQTITCGKNKEICRSLVPVKIKTKKIKKTPKLNFYNQATIVINCPDVAKVNVKLFKNGSIQLTGCKKISSVVWILDKLFALLRTEVGIPVDVPIIPTIIDIMNGVSHEKPAQPEELIGKHYADPYIFLNILDMTDLKIAMINSNFNIGFQIDREKLFNLLIAEQYDCEFDPSRHAGVKLRLKSHGISDHLSSIFVFDKGSIIITGSQNYMQIVECYKFINMYLIENYAKIVRITMA